MIHLGGTNRPRPAEDSDVCHRLDGHRRRTRPDRLGELVLLRRATACRGGAWRLRDRAPDRPRCASSCAVATSRPRCACPAGKPVRLVFDRQETSPCSEEVVFPDFGIRKFLPTDRPTTVEITPPAPGPVRVHLRHVDAPRRRRRRSDEEDEMARTMNVMQKPEPEPTPAGASTPPVDGERTIRIPVSGMTCAACQARVQRTLQKQRRRRGRRREPHDARRHRVATSRTRRRPSSSSRRSARPGYGAELPPAEQSAFDEQRARDEAQEHEFVELRRKAIVSGVAGALAMFAPMALMTVVPTRALNIALLVLTVAVMALGRTPLLRPRLDRLPPSLGGHEHADRRRARAPRSCTRSSRRSRPASSSRRGVAPDVYYEAVIIIIALILTGNAFEARAKRETSARAARARQPPAADGARRSRRGCSGRRSTCRSTTCGAATWSSCGRASASRWTARSSPARARSTSRCSPASRCRWRSTPAIG